MTEARPQSVRTGSGEVLEPGAAGELVACWVAVANAGGAVGFPFPPVGEAEVRPVAEKLFGEVGGGTCRLVTARVGGRMAGWLAVRRQSDPLVAHWGTVHHVQTHPAFRRRGVGAALMAEARRLAREEWGLEQLHLAARGGAGLEGFYERLGWREAGRWPGALRLSPGDDRDDVLMVLSPL
ncbi:GNAT family N-acetyltransferase [Streptomyces sulphureus]|uniref:GNAT family N-acetyltransferase n=1 Tax=Streptomyces sulphureus TaxID=47758 RepID=UPI0006871E4E|nr:GNAT family N-acetyltransferase [Streptomyces sulphureus]